MSKDFKVLSIVHLILWLIYETTTKEDNWCIEKQFLLLYFKMLNKNNTAYKLNKLIYNLNHYSNDKKPI